MIQGRGKEENGRDSHLWHNSNCFEKMKGTVYPAQVYQSDRIKESSCLHRSYALAKLDYFNFYYFYDVRTEFF